MTSYFFFGFAPPSPDGHKHISVGPDYRVEGGDKEGHAHTREVVEKFADKVKKQPSMPPPQEAVELLHDVLRQVGPLPVRRR